MQIRASQPRQDIESLLRDVSQLKDGVRRVDRDYQTGQRHIQDGEGELRWTSFPLSQAERDNAQTNVSSAGWELDRYLRNTDNDLRYADRELDDAQGTGRQVSSGMDSAKGKLRQIKSQVADQPEVAQSLDKAANSLDAAKANHDSASNDAGWSRNKNSSAESDINFSGMYVSNIRNDRPGVDVSNDARQLRFRIDQMSWSLRDSDNYLRSADTKESRSGSDLDAVEQALRDALNKLPA